MSTPEQMCAFTGCGRQILAKGLCSSHYKQQRAGQELRPLRVAMSISERLAAYSEPSGDCLLWIAQRHEKGYGRVKWNGRSWGAHRVAYTLEHGPIPEGMEVNHICGNRSCVKTAHLELVTRQRNVEYLTRLRRDNKSGYRGVHLTKRGGQYNAYVSAGGTRHHLGYFATAEEAAKAAAEGRARLHSMPEFADRFVAEAVTS